MFNEDARRSREVVIFNPRGWTLVVDHANERVTDCIESVVCCLGMVLVPDHQLGGPQCRELTIVD